ncbi:MAG: sulfatase-like hydrolase/transferase, partial [Acidobacteria bacterium]|nr:sulfatase-like hydrolase/transferase [Acidobacteriota bacterium]
ARDGVHLKNAFVTTALCSPSRASILTGKYAHRHKIVDNNTPIPRGTAFFPQLLQKAGYATGFFGKWHMGNASDDPQPGFSRWVSFLGQGSYLPEKNGLNVDGKKVPQKGYITDELTDYALDWINARKKGEPYFVYLSHKAVHAEFIPAQRHRDAYKNEKFVPPPSMAAGGDMARGRPRWVRDQRNSWHGVDFPYHSDLGIDEYYKRYAETLLGVDDSVGRVLEALRQRGELDSTLLIYMGDNGFAFGEHGLIDKRTAYEESMRVPMLARCPELFGGGRVVNQVVANLDIMPTVLAAAGVPALAGLDGADFLPLAQGRPVPWHDSLGRVLEALRRRGELDSTLLIYMGDNGFAFGEHGLIDKRTAYEESMRVPMLARCPELFAGGRVVDQVVANIDIMPTVLAAAGVPAPAGLDGADFLPLAQGRPIPWRDSLLYEYYWERNFPQTPTLHALRTDQYKYIRCHGIWDIDELYDIREDPNETNNLISSPKQADVVKRMNQRLFEILANTDGLSMPLYPDSGGQQNLRRRGRPRRPSSRRNWSEIRNASSEPGDDHETWFCDFTFFQPVGPGPESLRPHHGPGRGFGRGDGSGHRHPRGQRRDQRRDPDRQQRGGQLRDPEP